MHVAWARSVRAQIKQEGVFQTGERQRGEEAADATSRYVPLSARATGPGAPGCQGYAALLPVRTLVLIPKARSHRARWRRNERTGRGNACGDILQPAFLGPLESGRYFSLEATAKPAVVWAKPGALKHVRHTASKHSCSPSSRHRRRGSEAR